MNEWQPIESIPLDGSSVLVWLPEKMLGSHVHSASYRKNLKRIGGVFDFDAPCKPTHWMPEPDPPKP